MIYTVQYTLYLPQKKSPTTSNNLVILMPAWYLLDKQYVALPSNL